MFKRLSFAATSLATLTFSTITTQAEYPPVGWETDVQKAVTRASNEGKNLLVNFAGSDWCGWCIKLEKEVFSTPRFREYARQHLVLLFIDSPQRHELTAAQKKQNETFSKMLGVEGFPTIWMFAHDLTPLKKTGYKKGGPENYITHLENDHLDLDADKKKSFRKAFRKSLKDHLGVVVPNKTNNAKRHIPAGWITSLDKAKEIAQRDNKEILVYFSGSDWCGWCIKLHKEVIDKDYFIREAPKKYVLVYLDSPARYKQPAELKASVTKLKKEFEIKGFPTLLILDAKGREAARTGYKAGGAETYVKHLNGLFRIKWR